jgi:hypothetical protein
LLRALVISPNQKTADVGSVLAVARAEACRREHVSVNPLVKALVFVPELGVYVGIYKAAVCGKPECDSKGVGRRVE